MEERVEIRVGIDRGESFAEIARRLGRRDTTVSREVKRNHGRSRYDPVAAQRRADRCLRRPKTPKLVADPALAKLVQADLRAGFSPAGIAARLRAANHPTVCHETIYQALYSTTFRGLTLRPRQCLRSRRNRRNPYRGRKARDARQAWISKIRSIDQRPRSAEHRRQGGHWEGDLLMGKKGTNAVVTLIERASRYALLAPVNSGKHPYAVAAALADAFHQLPRSMRRTLTWDQGTELIGNWPHLEDALDMRIYFCHPHSPWERPSNENLNRQLRFWLPKGSDLGHHDQASLDRITNVLNNQPRKMFDWQTPAQRYAQLTMR